MRICRLLRPRVVKDGRRILVDSRCRFTALDALGHGRRLDWPLVDALKRASGDMDVNHRHGAVSLHYDDRQESRISALSIRRDGAIRRPQQTGASRSLGSS
jgi:hypothetical protein